MRISRLEALAAEGPVALWGWGREGRAAYRAIRDRLPGLSLTLFCSEEEAADANAIGDDRLRVLPAADAEPLAACAVVVKSPGISPLRPEAAAAAARGTRFVGGTGLWFGERPDARTICVTGTKGKSTTTALLAHLLRAAGVRTALAGNIGLPLLELLDAHADAWAIELSSYQTRDVAASGTPPEIAVVTNLFPEHLDWHGSEQRYIDDKLALVTRARPRIAVLNARDERLRALGQGLAGTEVRWFGDEAGWHLRDDDWIHRGRERMWDARALQLPGRHNRGNACAVLAAIDAFGLDAAALLPALAEFQPLPHRLQSLGMRGGIRYINDSISTTPHATLAALDVFRGQRVALLAGGHDRGLDWTGFVDAMRVDAPAVIVTMGANGPRIHEALAAVAGAVGCELLGADGLEDAMARGRRALGDEGLLLLSPGAPSFGEFTDYTDRGRRFASLAGFDPDAISAIPGLGIA